MVNYRRNFVSGGTFFFTVTLRNRKSCLLIDKIHLLKSGRAKSEREAPLSAKSLCYVTRTPSYDLGVATW